MTKYHKWNDDEINFVRKNYSILGTDGCSKRLNLSRGQILTFAFRNNIKVSASFKSDISKAQHEANRKKNALLAKELIITTPEQSYTLGFLWGDGYLFKRYESESSGRYYARLEMNAEDYKNICPWFEDFGKWITGPRFKKGYPPLIHSTLFDAVFGAFLKFYNYDLKSKISPSKILKTIPKKLHEYFWRGYIDADGCFCWNKTQGCFTITGHYDQNWIDMENLFKKLKIKYTLERRHSKIGSVSRLCIYNKNGISSLGNYIYCHNPHISLTRKYKKFLNITKT